MEIEIGKTYQSVCEGKELDISMKIIGVKKNKILCCLYQVYNGEVAYQKNIEKSIEWLETLLKEQRVIEKTFLN